MNQAHSTSFYNSVGLDKQTGGAIYNKMKGPAQPPLSCTSLHCIPEPDGTFNNWQQPIHLVWVIIAEQLQTGGQLGMEWYLVHPVLHFTLCCCQEQKLRAISTAQPANQHKVKSRLLLLTHFSAGIFTMWNEDSNLHYSHSSDSKETVY
jgi:hypothetical protein